MSLVSNYKPHKYYSAPIPYLDLDGQLPGRSDDEGLRSLGRAEVGANARSQEVMEDPETNKITTTQNSNLSSW